MAITVAFLNIVFVAIILRITLDNHKQAFEPSCFTYFR